MLQPLLTGEPLALDLVDTRWAEGGRAVDLLDDADALDAWLRRHDLRTATDAALVREPLVEVRSAVRGLLEGEPDAPRRFAAVLDRGRLRLTLVDGRPGAEPEVDDPAWDPAWRVARAHLELLASVPSDRIRRCAGAGCVLWFLDTSRNGTRRWCSMAGCGNRAKARQHYRRHRAAGPG